MEQLMERLRAFLVKNSFTLVVAGVTLVTVISAARVALPARRQKAELAGELVRLDAVIARSNLWVTQFQPASNEETAVWQNSATDIQALGVKPSEKLTLAQVVSRRADNAGYGRAQLKFVPVEGPNPVPPRNVAGVTFNPAPYKLVITGEGGFGTLAAFLGTLPPAVELQSVSLTAGDAQANTSITLSVFEPAGAR
jgi:hypothetical protein